MKIKDKIMEMATRARTQSLQLSILDARMITACIPEEVTDEYIYLDDGWEIGRTGTLGGDPVEYERIAKGGKLIRIDAIISIDFIKTPKK